MSGGKSDRVVVLVGRRFFSAEQKRAIVAEASRVGVNVSAVARSHNMKPSLLFRWKREAFEASMQTSSPPPPALVPVVVSPPGAQSDSPARRVVPAPEHRSFGPVMFEIVTARGLTLRVPSDADADSIRRFVSALDGTS